MSRLLRSLLLALPFTACAHAPPPLVDGLDPSPPLTVFSDIAVFTGADASPALTDQDVWVRGARIEHVGAAGSKPVPPEAVVVPGAGLTLMPGLIDGHVHATAGYAPPWDLRLPDAERNLQSYLYAGITTGVDVGGGAKTLAKLRSDLAAGKRLGPHLLIAGPVFTAPGGHPIALINQVVPWPLNHFAADIAVQVGTPAEADEALDDLLPLHPDVIKLVSDELPLGVPTMSQEVANEIVRRAHQAGLKAVAHVGSNADMTKMLDAGIDVFVHDAYREKLSDEVAERIGKAGIPVEATLAVFDDIDRLSAGDLTYSSLSQRVADPRVLASLQHEPSDYEIPASFKSWLEVTHANRQIKFDNVATLRRHGVVILAGSDSPNVAHLPGAALHTELGDLVQAGLTPAEALYAATGANAKVFGLLPQVGTIAEGQRADLLVLHGDPTADIHALDAIEAVYLDGLKVQREP